MCDATARGATAPATCDPVRCRLTRHARRLDAAVPVRLVADWVETVPVDQLDTRDFDGRGRPLARWTTSEPEGGAL